MRESRSSISFGHGVAPLITTTRVAEVATSTKPDTPDPTGDAGGHVPTAIYEVVKYIRKGQTGAALVSEQVRRVVEHIESHFCIPADFERSHKFGPHSGLTFETRLARAYAHHLLSPKRQPAPADMCLTCGHLGHSRRACPDGF